MYQRQVTFGEAVNKALAQNYCNFNGRASRSEYWWYVLFTAILGMAIGFILGIFGAGVSCFAPSRFGIICPSPSRYFQKRMVDFYRAYTSGRSNPFACMVLQAF